MPRQRKSSGTGYQGRRTNNRTPLPRFLIVCEGQKTEPAYFESFRVPSVTIDVVGLARDPFTLVQQAINRCQQNKNRYDQVWCVFDRDDVPLERFRQALVLAKQHRVRVAYSNQAFELWYLLHFCYCDVALTRRDYIDRLNHSLNRPYQKTDLTLYAQLLSRQEDAVQNAQRLLKQYDPPNPAVDDPSTTVHELVQLLNRFVPERRLER